MSPLAPSATGLMTAVGTTRIGGLIIDPGAPSTDVKLDVHPLAEVVFATYRARLTGRISIAAPTVTRPVTMHVRDGYPVAAEAIGTESRLGELLRGTGLDTQALARHVAQAQAAGLKLGQHLLRSHVISEEELDRALREQVRRRQVVSLLSVDGTGARALVFPGAHDAGLENGQPLRVHPRRAIYLAVRGAWPAERVMEQLSPFVEQRVRLLLDDGTIARYGLAPADLAVVNRLATMPRGATGGELAIATGSDLFTVCSLLLSLHFTDALAFVSTATPERPMPIAAPEIEAAAATRSRLPDRAELARAIPAKLRGLDEQDHFEVLGVDEKATREQIKSAYLEAAKRFHPDRAVAVGLAQLAADAARIFRRLTEAHATLTDDARRADYLRRRSGVASDSELGRRLVDAELAFLRGEALVRQGQSMAALGELERAVALNPDEPEHRALLAWARLGAGRVTAAQVRPELEAIIRKAPRSARAHYYLGVVFRELGDVERANATLRRCVELDPRHLDAERELRVLAMRRKK